MLRYFTSTLTAFALGGMITVMAQSQAPPSQPPAEQEKPAAEPATLTGCVQEAKTTDGGKVYVLNKAEGGSAPMYLLTGPPPSELASHVNHKLEVKGQVQQPPQDEAPKDAKVVRPPVVQVESMKTVAETCQ